MIVGTVITGVQLQTNAVREVVFQPVDPVDGAILERDALILVRNRGTVACYVTVSPRQMTTTGVWCTACPVDEDTLIDASACHLTFDADEGVSVAALYLP